MRHSQAIRVCHPMGCTRRQARQQHRAQIRVWVVNGAFALCLLLALAEILALPALEPRTHKDASAAAHKQVAGTLLADGEGK